MAEQELPSITITENDVQEANQLSLHCPICANPVENYVTTADLQPVVCRQCGTLYHKACWQQGGGKCAVLGCGHTEYRVYGTQLRPILKVDYKDIPKQPVNGRPRTPSPSTKQLKDEQRRQVEQLRRPSLLQRLWQWLLDQIKIG
jgi:hypothetical protein